METFVQRFIRTMSAPHVRSDLIILGMRHCVVAPLLEEIGKSLLVVVAAPLGVPAPVVHVGFGLWELYATVSSGAHLMYRLPAFALHCVLGFCPRFATRWRLHMLFNALSLVNLARLAVDSNVDSTAISTAALPSATRIILFGACALLLARWLAPYAKPLFSGSVSPSRYLTRVIKYLCIKPPLVQPSLPKALVFEVNFASPKTPDNHSHPNCAALRSQAVSWIERCAAHIGRRAVWLQARASDVRAGRVHDTEWYWSKDLGVPQKTTQLQPGDIAVCVDSDYYADMPTLMAANPDVVFALFTFTPSDAGATSEEYSYCFLRTGEVCLNLSGGAKFKHKLWNYASDELSATGGIWDHTSYYLVERRQVGPDWAVVWLWPTGSVRWGTNWLLRRLDIVLDATPLRRFNPVDGDFARFTIVSKDNTEITTARLGSYSACTISADVDSRVRAAAYATTVTMTNHTVQSYGVAKDEAIFLTDYWRSAQHRDLIERVVVGNPPAVVHYECGPTIDPESKTSVKAFMEPLITGSAFAPLVSEGNMAAAIQTRILDITDDTDISPFVECCMTEFLELVLRDARMQAHSLTYGDMEDVLKRQKSRNQKVQAERAAVSDLTEEQDGGSFMKREPYPEIKEPRVITQFKEVDKTVYAVALDMLLDTLKSCAWYSFVEPVELEARMLNKLGGKPCLYETDFSRMDGRYGQVLRLLELRFALLLLEYDSHEQFLTDYKRDHHKRIFAAFELSYMTEWHRLSGSPATSGFNTLGNAFCQYVSFRTKYAPGGAKRGFTKQLKYEPSVAYDMIGMCGGDDGLVALPTGFDPGRLEYGCGLCGQRVKLASPGPVVTFLGRLYGELKTHSANSCADIRRQLVKFHLTTDGLCDPVRKFCEKGYAFHVLDPNTPLLGQLGKKAARLAGKLRISQDFAFRDSSLSYNAAEHLRQHQTVFTNYSADWMLNVVLRDLSGFDLTRFTSWCENDSLHIDKPFLSVELALPATVTHPVIDATVHDRKISLEQLRKLRKKVKRGKATKPVPSAPSAAVTAAPSGKG